MICSRVVVIDGLDDLDTPLGNDDLPFEGAFGCFDC